MKHFTKLYAITILLLILGFLGANLLLNRSMKQEQTGRPHRVEISRLAKEIQKNGSRKIDLSDCIYVSNIEQYHFNDKTFFHHTDTDSVFMQINDTLYRFDYSYVSPSNHQKIIIVVNGILAVISFLFLALLVYIQQKILKPFEVLCDIPYELAKGNLTIPVKEQKNHYFGKFIWGINMLREHLELQKQHELSLLREKKTLVLSISHDIKTPLSAIKLYSKALSKGLYTDKNKQIEISENIHDKADEIEAFVSQIIKASNEDFLNLEVVQGKFYLSELVEKTASFYNEKLKLIKTDFIIGEYSDCFLKGDLDRGIEVVQNIIENAIKYGDGHEIKLSFSEEDDCRLLLITNSGCTLSDSELPHIFESFWRGSNSGNSNGSGLGLYICRQLMLKMDGEIFAEIQGDSMCITVVFRKMN